MSLLTGLVAAQEPAHRELRFDAGRYFLESPEGGREVADVSGFCLACHGGEGGAPGHPAAPGRGGSGPDIGRSHPVDLDYLTARGDLTPPEDLDRRLELRDGEITCLTCHAAAAPDHRLVIPLRRGELCLACHRQ